jgi:hypothetical protein
MDIFSIALNSTRHTVELVQESLDFLMQLARVDGLAQLFQADLLDR